MGPTVRDALQTAATSGNGKAVDLKGMTSVLTFYIVGTGTISAGAIQIEEARATDYAGTWCPIGSPITVVSGETKAVHVQGGRYLAIRARISTAIAGGGDVTVEMVGGER